MTVIAWDGETLAADRRLTCGPSISSCSKIRKGRDGSFIGMAGNAAASEYLALWYEGLVEYNHEQMKAGTLLVITKEKKCLRFDGDAPVGYVVDIPTAIGNGDESAMVAMHCGKSAIEAVEITSLFNTTCGNGVDYLRFGE